MTSIGINTSRGADRADFKMDEKQHVILQSALADLGIDRSFHKGATGRSEITLKRNEIGKVREYINEKYSDIFTLELALEMALKTSNK